MALIIPALRYNPALGLNLRSLELVDLGRMLPENHENDLYFALRANSELAISFRHDFSLQITWIYPLGSDGHWPVS